MKPKEPRVMAMEEAFRLMHKFCPQSKTFTTDNFSPNNYNNAWTLLEAVNPNYDYWNPVPYPGPKNSDLLKAILGDSINDEKARVLVFPDINNAPFACKADKLYERVDEQVWGIQLDGELDVMLVFESTGRILFFGHENCCGLASPFYKEHSK